MSVDGSIILCTHNRASHLRVALESLRSLDQAQLGSWELIVVDNNSTDDTRTVVDSFQQTVFSSVRYLFCGVPGKSNALNAGIQAAKGDLLAFTDDDVQFDSHWLTAIQARLADSDVIGIGGRIVPMWDSPRPRWYSEDGPYRLMAVIVRYDLGLAPTRVTTKTPPYGANMAFRRSAFERHGLFRSDLGPLGRTLLRGEDTEFVRRVLAAGERIDYAPDMVVYHPVESHRIQRDYYRRWYYDYGRSIARIDRPPADAVRYFGVPRYLIRILLGQLVSWATALRTQRRFFYQLNAAMTIGSIVEERRLFGSKPGSPLSH